MRMTFACLLIWGFHRLFAIAKKSLHYRRTHTRHRLRLSSATPLNLAQWYLSTEKIFAIQLLLPLFIPISIESVIVVLIAASSAFLLPRLSSPHPHSSFPPYFARLYPSSPHLSWFRLSSSLFLSSWLLLDGKCTIFALFQATLLISFLLLTRAKVCPQMNLDLSSNCFHPPLHLSRANPLMWACKVQADELPLIILIRSMISFKDRQ